MKKKTNNQLSIFDIEFPSVRQELPVPMPVSMERKVQKAGEQKNVCPYKIPTVEEIMKRIKSAVYRVDTHQLISDVFECGAIAISNQVDLLQRDEREERYKKIMEKYQPKERELLAEIFGMIFALLSSVVYDNGCFDDYLGELFMRCNQGNSNAGDEVLEKSERNEILTVNDPCCGGGGLLIAALDVLKNEYNINYARNCFMEASDIDIRCVHMTYLQLSLAGVPAIIKHQNALTRELWSVWRTPAYVFQYLRFQKYENLN